MKPPARLVLFLVALFLVAGICPRAIASDQGLFINLTSDEINRAAMAIFLAQKVLDEKGADVVVFLNVEGVRLADRRITRHTHASGADAHQMLRKLMAGGGKVYACPMCMQYVGGMEAEHLLEGVQTATMENVWAALFDKEMRVLSY